MRSARAKPGTPGASRKERHEQSLRARAASETVRNAFPAVEYIRRAPDFVAATEPAPAPQALVLHPPARAYFEFPCPWSDCDGHFDLTAITHDAIGHDRKLVEGTLVCGGQRVRNRIPKLSCDLRVNYSLSVQYLK